ncbi:hypothetical protein SDC9_103185 [bioreactor metagenome]|uniref:Uncharacterized protein n=1 Tax=bioreactor metagenome TaxID=1076179 RepID=A0A645AZP6_9ZZZZ
MTGQCAVANAHIADLGKSGLERGHKLALELGINFVTTINALDVAADVGKEQKRIDEFIGVFAKAANRNVDIQTDVAVYHAERDGIRRAVFVADYFLFVEEVNALILSRVAAKADTFGNQLQGGKKTFAEPAVKQGRLGGGIVEEFAGLVGEFNDFALLDDHHELPFVDGNDRTV